WTVLSIALVIGHFIVPFLALLSYPSKTDPKRLKFMSVWILVFQFLDTYWMIMPGMKVESGGYFFSWSDRVFPIAVVGLVIVVFNAMAKKYNWIPVGDPKLQRGFDFRL
ncbi:MAG: quinol:cytochrome C oxidoreductase, partial [Ignavibacteriaceae bacterium]